MGKRKPEGKNPTNFFQRVIRGMLGRQEKREQIADEIWRVAGYEFVSEFYGGQYFPAMSGGTESSPSDVLSLRVEDINPDIVEAAFEKLRETQIKPRLATQQIVRAISVYPVGSEQYNELFRLVLPRVEERLQRE